MPLRIGKKSFPDTAAGMLKHRQLAIKLHTFCHSRLGSENSAFILMMDVRKRPQFIYEDYIRNGAKDAVNISAPMRRPCDALAEQGDWSPRSWQEPLNTIRGEVIQMINQNNMYDFLRSEIFREFCFKVAGTDRKAAKLLGLKNVTEVGDILMHYHRGERANAERKMTALIRREKKKNKTAENMYDKLKDKGFVA